MAGASRGRGRGRGGGNFGRPHISIGNEKVEPDDPLDFKAPELFPSLRANITEIEEDSEDDDLIIFEKQLAKHFHEAASFISKEDFTSPWSYLKTIENHNYFPPSLLPKKKKTIDEKPFSDIQWMDKLKDEVINHDYLSLKQVISAKKTKIDDFLNPTSKKKAKVENNPTTSQLINENAVKELDEEEDIDVEDSDETKKKDEEKEGEVKDIDEEYESDVDDELDDGTDYNKNYFDNGEGYLDDDDDGLDDNDAIY
ncbi:DNA-directed RNA polymerase III subunit RPC7-like [Daktulosphaira vitifoliae]|uniref:DNA-directed RNA polymerase III subunit RPC7-like n=1 Tax=Daktulosphaira vitifoliae TaxID=58002 RepID=UPI0021A9FCE2|nr:DNA-directed RNA polymerase III subunit RPC7-like [Daktulosphaira vitifoliae]